MESRNNILVVDDEAIIRKSLELILVKAGYRVQSAKSGEIALENLDETPPDVCLIDMDLPGMDGRKLAREVLKRYPSVRIILLTGFYGISREFSGDQKNIFKFLYKPVDIDLLLDSVEKALSQ